MNFDLKFWRGFFPAMIILIISCSDDSQNPLSPPPQPPDPVDEYTFRVIEEFPHRQDAFTQGLQYLNGFLYESTGLYGQSSLRKVDLTSGMVLDSFQLNNQFFAEGLTILHDKIYQLTWRSSVGFVYGLQDLAPIDTFTYETEGWGLTNDGTHLIMSDGTNIIRYRDPASFDEVRRIEVFWQETAVNRINELEYIDDKIYANIWLTDRIAIISPDSGAVLSWINLDSILTAEDCSQYIDVLNGIAYDEAGDRLLVTGKQWCKLFHIELIPLE